ncbi:MAG TPA: RIP metalloprotease RseP [Desulfosalsimonadaceae bacterium]|nr:RIP metalloprotease RseP [Desulfosalsimonadaceae bacterium]
MSMVIGIVVVLGVLIFFHELGHFLCAKAFGVGVQKFSLGFGPKILSKTVGSTEYCLSAVPLGGFVKMVGEQPDEEISGEDLARSFTHKPVAQRMLIVAAGPLFNFFLAVLIFFMVFSISGIRVLEPVVGKVSQESPAAAAGIAEGDRIVAINGHEVEHWSEMADYISGSRGRALELRVKRGTETVEIRVSPEKQSTENIFGEKTSRYVIGITASGDTLSKELGLLEAGGESLYRTYLITKLTIVSVVKLIEGAVSVKTLGGPIMIAQMAGEQAEEGAVNLMFFIALVSINLGILNLLPIPVLDGGHLLFFSIEAATGRPVSLKTREIAQQVGILLLMMLMVFVFYNDIMRIVSG